MLCIKGCRTVVGEKGRGYHVRIEKRSTMTNYYEKQYSALDELNNKFGVPSLGLMSGFTWNSDPRRLLFVLSRYKFVAKMFQGYQDVLEVGCGDAFASRIVAQSVSKLDVTDIDEKLLENANINAVSGPFPYNCFWHDLFASPTPKPYNGIYLLDVLEHIPQKEEHHFLKNICGSLRPHGQVIIGIPSIESQVYASEASKKGHVNCKTQRDLSLLLDQFFWNVNMFSMNDEVLHTGYGPMSHYLMALCSDRK